MGRRGPKPQPAGIREQKTPVRSKHKKASAPADQGASGFVAAPDWLKGRGLSIWNRMAPGLRISKLLTEADAPAFARYCKHYARWLDLQERLDTNGDIYVIETASGQVRRADPAFVMSDRLDRMLLALEDRFGLNPAERQRIFAARAQTGTSGGLFDAPPTQPQARSDDDPAAKAAGAAKPSDEPVGFLN